MGMGIPPGPWQGLHWTALALEGSTREGVKGCRFGSGLCSVTGVLWGQRRCRGQPGAGVPVSLVPAAWWNQRVTRPLPAGGLGGNCLAA